MDFNTFIETYKEKLHEIFTTHDQAGENTLSRGIDDGFLKEILDLKPLKAFIPKEYGGFGGNTAEALTMLEASSYESLPLSLMMGINGALFLQPTANYADEEVKTEVFSRIINDNKLGGLMITEPDFGSDALHMQTSFVKEGQKYHIQGIKHWGGLTGMADYWLVTARGVDDKGNLARDISFFIHDTRNGGIEVKEYYNNLGLYMLPYGRNHLDITVDKSFKLEPQTTGVTMMLDLLHRSRLQFPGMGMGFLRRMMDEAVDHCKERFVGGKSLIKYDQVKRRISELQAYFTICSGSAYFTGSQVPLSLNTSRMNVEGNAIKTIVTDFMQTASQSLLQLTGAKGYRLDHIAGRSTVDSRPFQIFEGSNDILYQQISEAIIKAMNKMKMNNLHEFLSEYKLTNQAADYFKDHFNFEIDKKMPQRKLVDLGKVLGRVITLQFTLKMGEKGFNNNLIDNAVKVMQSEIASIMANFKEASLADVVDEYKTNSSWFEYANMKEAQTA